MNETEEQKEPDGANICGVALSEGWGWGSHVSVGVDAAVLLHVLHLGWVNMLDLWNSLRLHTGNGRRFSGAAGPGGKKMGGAGRTCGWTGTCWAEPVGWTGTLV